MCLCVFLRSKVNYIGHDVKGRSLVGEKHCRLHSAVAMETALVILDSSALLSMLSTLIWSLLQIALQVTGILNVKAVAFISIELNSVFPEVKMPFIFSIRISIISHNV